VSQESTEQDFVHYVRSNSRALYAQALGLCRNRALAEDILQITFMHLWKAWPGIERNQKTVPMSYARKILDNCFKDSYRMTKRRPEESDWEDNLSDSISSAYNIEEEILFSEMSRELWAAVATLPEVQQQLISFIYIDGLNLSAAAREIGLTGTTARRYHTDALSRLRSMIEHHNKEDQDGGR